VDTAPPQVSTAAPRHPALLALGLAAGPAAALGLARFAYALLLPSMQSVLHWSFATAAVMNTANAAGYLIGALLAAPVARRLGVKKVFLGGIALTAVLLACSALTGDLAVLLVLRLLAGTCGAATFIAGAALAAGLGHGAPPFRSALLLGIYFGGGGVGIAISGVILPYLLAHTSAASGWKWGWVALSIGAALALIAALPAAIRTPQPGGERRHETTRLPGLRPILVAYTAYGAGYIAYMTFIVSYLKAGGAGTAEVSTFWAVLGVAAVVGGVIWGPVLARLEAGRGPSLLIAVVTLGAILPLVSRAAPVAFASAALFGVSFLAVVASVTHVARVTLPPAQWTAAIAILTTGFALGQCVGPILSGLLADHSGGVRAGLVVSVVILVAAAGTCLLQRPRGVAQPAMSST
jgi:predicted MFS family arabinose efflux permease